MRILYFTFDPTLQYNRPTSPYRGAVQKETSVHYSSASDFLLRLLGSSRCLYRLAVHPYNAESQESNNGG